MRPAWDARHEPSPDDERRRIPSPAPRHDRTTAIDQLREAALDLEPVVRSGRFDDLLRWIAVTPGETRLASAGQSSDLRRLVDLPCFGRPALLVWHQVRWRCPDPECPVGSWMQVDERIVVGNRGITDRAARWACEQVGRHGRTVSEVADDLGCDWHTVNRAVVAYGLALVDDPARIGPVRVLGLDETSFVRHGPWRQRTWSTAIVGDGTLLASLRVVTPCPPAPG